MLQVSGEHQCAECVGTHPERDCGACMYGNAKQVIAPDEEESGPMYPIFECKRCGARHFWD